MVTMMIISILVSVGMFNMLEAQTRSKVARVRMDSQTIATAITAYSTDNQEFAPPAPYDEMVVPYFQGPQQFAESPGAFHLTTPISYLVSIPCSVFLSQAPKVRPGPGVGYFLFNYLFHSRLNQTLPPGDQCPFCDDFKASGVEWVIWSLGPGLGDPSDTDDVVYDPTNGTLSWGRISLFGDKGAHSHLYELRPE